MRIIRTLRDTTVTITLPSGEREATQLLSSLVLVTEHRSFFSVKIELGILSIKKYSESLQASLESNLASELAKT